MLDQLLLAVAWSAVGFMAASLWLRPDIWGWGDEDE